MLSYERRHRNFLLFPARYGGALNTVGLVRNIEINTADAPSSGGAVTDLHSFTLLANSLRRDEDYLIVDYGGFFAANTNNKRVLALFDGNIYEDGLAVIQDLDGGSFNGWRFLNKIIRLSATSVRVQSLFAGQFIQMSPAAIMTAPANAGYLQLNRNRDFTVSNLNSNAIIMLVQGQGVANGDVVQNATTIEIVQN